MWFKAQQSYEMEIQMYSNVIHISNKYLRFLCTLKIDVFLLDIA